jgi:hypothetical protein
MCYLTAFTESCRAPAIFALWIGTSIKRHPIGQQVRNQGTFKCIQDDEASAVYIEIADSFLETKWNGMCEEQKLCYGIFYHSLSAQSQSQ